MCKRLAAECGYPLSVSATTRSPRESEVNGREYFFLSRPEFLAAAARGEFLEHSEHFDNLYGTPKAAVEERIAAGEALLLEIDVNGAAQVMDALPAEKARVRLFDRAGRRRERAQAALAAQRIGSLDPYAFAARRGPKRPQP